MRAPSSLRSGSAVAAVVAFVAQRLVVQVASFPTGAGSCGPGLAVNGPHLNDPLLSTLAATQVEVEVDGIPLITTTRLSLGVGPVPVVVTSSSSPIRGILLRAERDDGSLIEWTSTTPLLIPANVCSAPVAGLTHGTREDKTQVSGILTVDTPGTVSLQVTVVFFASAFEQSFHAFDEFMLAFVEPSVPDPTTATPTLSPVPLPTLPPTVSPINPPTDAPFTSTPIVSPTDAPTTSAPVDAVTSPPTLAPVLVPVVPATNAPVALLEPRVISPPDSPTKRSSSKSSKGNGMMKSMEGEGKMKSTTEPKENKSEKREIPKKKKGEKAVPKEAKRKASSSKKEKIKTRSAPAVKARKMSSNEKKSKLKTP